MKLNINGNLVEVSDDILSKAIEAKTESIDVKTDGLVIRTKEEQETFETNLRTEVGNHKVEIGRKEVLSGLGIEIDGKGLHKTLDKSLEAIKGFVTTSTQTALTEAGKAPDGKIVELTKDLETLRGNLVAKDEELESSKGDFVKYKNQATVNSSLTSELGKFKDINNSSNSLLIFNSKVKTGLDENGIVRGYDAQGIVMKDANLNPLGIDSVVSQYYDNNPDSLVKTSGGAGGGDSSNTGGSATDWEAFVKRQTEAGNSPASDEFREAQARDVKSGALVL